MHSFKTWHKGLALTLPLIALLAGCNRGDKAEEPKTHAVATYVSAPWEALPSVSDEDLLAGFGSWRSACTRLKADTVWGTTCAAAANVPLTAADVRHFLKQILDVYGLRSKLEEPRVGRKGV